MHCSSTASGRRLRIRLYSCACLLFVGISLALIFLDNHLAPKLVSRATLDLGQVKQWYAAHPEQVPEVLTRIADRTPVITDVSYAALGGSRALFNVHWNGNLVRDLLSFDPEKGNIGYCFTGAPTPARVEYPDFAWDFLGPPDEPALVCAGSEYLVHTAIYSPCRALSYTIGLLVTDPKTGDLLEAMPVFPGTDAMEINGGYPGDFGNERLAIWGDEYRNPRTTSATVVQLLSIYSFENAKRITQLAPPSQSQRYSCSRVLWIDDDHVLAVLSAQNRLEVPVYQVSTGRIVTDLARLIRPGPSTSLSVCKSGPRLYIGANQTPAYTDGCVYEFDPGSLKSLHVFEDPLAWRADPWAFYTFRDFAPSLQAGTVCYAPGFGYQVAATDRHFAVLTTWGFFGGLRGASVSIFDKQNRKLQTRLRFPPGTVDDTQFMNIAASGNLLYLIGQSRTRWTFFGYDLGSLHDTGIAGWLPLAVTGAALLFLVSALGLVYSMLPSFRPARIAVSLQKGERNPVWMMLAHASATWGWPRLPKSAFARYLQRALATAVWVLILALFLYGAYSASGSSSASLILVHFWLFLWLLVSTFLIINSLGRVRRKELLDEILVIPVERGAYANALLRPFAGQAAWILMLYCAFCVVFGIGTDACAQAYANGRLLQLVLELACYACTIVAIPWLVLWSAAYHGSRVRLFGIWFGIPVYEVLLCYIIKPFLSGATRRNPLFFQILELISTPQFCVLFIAVPCLLAGTVLYVMCRKRLGSDLRNRAGTAGG